jgi:hypothetical protein
MDEKPFPEAGWRKKGFTAKHAGSEQFLIEPDRKKLYFLLTDCF